MIMGLLHCWLILRWQAAGRCAGWQFRRACLAGVILRPGLHLGLHQTIDIHVVGHFSGEI